MRIWGRCTLASFPVALTLVGVFAFFGTAANERESRGPLSYGRGSEIQRGSNLPHVHDHGGCRSFAGGSACFAPGTPEAAIDSALRRIPAGAAGYAAVNRWTSTATNGSISSGPITLTYSFVPDVSTGNNETSNSVHALLNAQFGAEATWKNLFADIFADWSAVSGITFVEEAADDGAAWPTSPGVLGVRGDVRIVAQPIDGALNVLAFNYFPNDGDMTLDTAEDWNDPTDGYRFLKNTLLHELGHGLGLEHVNPRDSTKLMEALLNLDFEGPQDDDIRGVQSYYGDSHEPNESLVAAETLGAYSPGASFSDLSLHGTADVDYLRITANQGQSINFTATPMGNAYTVGPDPGVPAVIDTRRIQRLRVRVYRSDGVTLLDDQSAASLGNAVTASGVVPTGGSSLIVVVSSAAGSNAPQRYSLALAQGAAALVTISVSSDAPGSVSATFSPPDDNGISNATLPASVEYYQGTSVQFSAPSSIGGVGFSRWSVDGVLQTPALNPLPLSISSGHTVVARYSNALVVDAGNDVTIDLGSPTTLTAAAAGGTAPYTFVWSPTSGLSQATGASVSASPIATTTYTVTATDFVGTSVTSDVVVTVTQPLTANAGPDQVVGAGTTGAMAGSASGGVGPHTYAWSPATGLSSLNSPTTPFTIFVARTYTLTVTDAVGDIATDTVTLTPATTLNVSASASASTLASGGSAALSASASGGVTPYTIVWSANGVNVGEGASISVSPTVTTTYSVNVSDSGGQSRSASLTVNVVGPLSVSVSGPTSPVAAGSAVSLSAVVSGGASPFSYSWTPASGVAVPNAADTSATVSASTTFAVDVSDALGQTGRADLTVSVGSSVGGQGTDADPGGNGGDVTGGGAIAPVIGPCGLTSVSLIGFAAMSLMRGRKCDGARFRR